MRWLVPATTAGNYGDCSSRTFSESARIMTFVPRQSHGTGAQHSESFDHLLHIFRVVQKTSSPQFSASLSISVRLHCMPSTNLDEDVVASIASGFISVERIQLSRHVVPKSRVAIATQPVIGLLKKPGSALTIA
jgi:hypothetical protein